MSRIKKDKSDEYFEPRPVHEHIFPWDALDPAELQQLCFALAEHMGLTVYRTNRNKHSETRIEVRKED